MACEYAVSIRAGQIGSSFEDLNLSKIKMQTDNQAQKAVATTPKNTGVAAKKDIREVILAQKQEIARALPRHMSADRMIRVMLTAVNTTPKLLLCSRDSLLSALMKCSQYGLEPDGRHAHLIPYKKGNDYECQLIFDYKGLVNLVRRSGDVSDIHCDVVYEKDHFEYGFGTNGCLNHTPNLKEQDRGEITCAYSFVKLKDGSTSFEVMPWWEIEKIKENSQGYQAFDKGFTKSNPWDSNWAEMAKKTVFRRHSKWLPLSFEISEAIHMDDDRQSEERFARAKQVQAAASLVETQTAALPESTQDDAALETAKPENEVTPAAQLVQFITSQSFTFKELCFWLKSGGHIEDSNITEAQLPTDVAERMLRSRAGMLRGLVEFRNEAEASRGAK
jgi:recombination protein RecT